MSQPLTLNMTRLMSFTTVQWIDITDVFDDQALDFPGYHFYKTNKKTLKTSEVLAEEQ